MNDPRRVLIAPSILNSDLGNLAEEMRSLERSGADLMHIDVMDGNFVPPISFGDNIVAVARKSCTLYREAHLMVLHPEQRIEAYRAAGAQRLIIHQEVVPNLRAALEAIRAAGMSPGVSINPPTAAETVYDVLDACDLVLVMSVNPGWGGQKFIPAALDKIRALRAEIARRKLQTLIEVDGGVNDQTAKQCRDAGVDLIVAGTYVCGSTDRAKAIASLRA